VAVTPEEDDAAFEAELRRFAAPAPSAGFKERVLRDAAVASPGSRTFERARRIAVAAALLATGALVGLAASSPRREDRPAAVSIARGPGARLSVASEAPWAGRLEAGRIQIKAGGPFELTTPLARVSGNVAELTVELVEGEDMKLNRGTVAAGALTFAVGVATGSVVLRSTDGSAERTVTAGEIAFVGSAIEVSDLASLRRSAEAGRGVPELEAALARANARAAAAEATAAELAKAVARPPRPAPTMDPIAEIVFSSTTLAEKLRAIAALPEKERHAAAWKLGQEWEEKKEHCPAVLAALRSESDPALLEILAGVIRAGALAGLEDESAVLGILRTGDPAERRIAAAWGVRPRGYGEGPAEWTAAVVDAIGAEQDARVLGVLADALYDSGESNKKVVDAFRACVGRLPAGEDRQLVLNTIGRATIFDTGPTELYSLWQTATPDLRDEIAAALARCSRSGSSTNDATKLAGTDTNKKTFLALYQETRPLGTRQQLVEAAVFDMPDEVKAAFVREIALLEPDVAQREGLERFAVATEKGELHGTADDERMIYRKQK
jgi:hypothetical protein